MFIRKTKKIDPKTKKSYFTYQLIESIRTEKGPRQRILLGLGSQLDLSEAERKNLANRIEEILHGINSLAPYPEKIESLAQKYASQLVARLSEQKEEKQEKKPLPDYTTIDLNTIEQQEPRTVGAEHLLLHIAKELQLPEKLKECGFSKSEIALSLGHIIGRAIAPGSDRSTHTWLKERSGLGELLNFDFDLTSLDRFYQLSDKLLKNKNPLEVHLDKQSQRVHQYKSTLVLYDLTNTYLTGKAKQNVKARFGRSKEKRFDCPLVTLGLAINEHGFISRSQVLPGNISEPITLQNAIRELDRDDLIRPTIILDAGIATEENLEWLRKENYKYIVSARQNPPSLDLDSHLTPVDKDEQVKVALLKTESEEEKWLYCESAAKEAVSKKMKEFFQKRFEADLKKLAEGIQKPKGRKKYQKVLERLGRLKEKHKRVAGCYEIIVTPSPDMKIATSINWELLPEKLEERLNSHYFLRTNHLNQTAPELWNLYNSLRTIEDVFRFMKSDLGMRPVYHQKEQRVDGHLWITVMAYHLIQYCHYQLRKKQISYNWKTILGKMNGRIRVTMKAKTSEGGVIYHRSTTKSEPSQNEIYQAIGISSQILRSKKFTS